MRSFIKRYFLGRKGADSGVQGVIISTGEKPLAQRLNRRNGINAFIEKGEVLAIDISIDQWSGTACCVDRLAFRLVDQLASNFADTVGTLRLDQTKLRQEHQKLEKGKFNQGIADVLWLFAAIGHWAYGEEKLGWWQGNNLPIVFRDFVKAVDGQEALYMSHLKLIDQSIPKEVEIGSVRVGYKTSLANIGGGRVLVPSSWLQKIIGNRSDLKQFLAWLRANRVISTKAGENCGSYHHPEAKATVRGYALWIKNIQRMKDRL